MTQPPQDRSRSPYTVDPAILAARDLRSRYLSDGLAALFGRLKAALAHSPADRPVVAAHTDPAARPS